MTREKKEIIKKINNIEMGIASDEALSYRCVPPGAFDRQYEEIYRLQEQLAKLSRYSSVEEMLMDDRGFRPNPNIPFA